MKETYLVFSCPNCLLECGAEKSAQGQTILCPNCEREFTADQPIGESEPPEYELSVETEQELDAMVLKLNEQSPKTNACLNKIERIKDSDFKKEWDKLLGRDLSTDEIHDLLEAHQNWRSCLFSEMLAGGFEQLKKESPQTVEFWLMLVNESLSRHGLEDKAMLVKENMLRLNDAFSVLVTGQKIDEIPEGATFGGRRGEKKMKMIIRRGGIVELSEATQEELVRNRLHCEMMNEIIQKQQERTKRRRAVTIKDLMRERLRLEAKYKDKESKLLAKEQR